MVHLLTFADTILCLWVRNIPIEDYPTTIFTRDHSKVTCVRCLDALNEVF